MNNKRRSALGVVVAVAALFATVVSFVVESGTRTFAASRSYTYNSYTAGSTWTVPYGVSSITVAAYGGAAGSGGIDGRAAGSGGVWGYVAATLSVAAGDVIGVYPGDSGSNGTGCYTSIGAGAGGADSYPSGAYNGGNGGNAGSVGCSGGGGGGGAASLVTKNSEIQLIAAGAGGGAGANNVSNAPSGTTGSLLSSATYGWTGGNGWDCSESDDGGGGGGGGGGYRGGNGGSVTNGGGECAGGGGSAGSNYVIAGATSVTNTTASSSAETITITYSATSVSTPLLASASDTGASNSDSITSSTALVFTGTATGGSSVQLKAGGVNTGSACTANTSTGAWSCTTAALAAGTTHSITAAATVDGQTVTSSATTVTVDTTAPTPTITSASIVPPSGVAVQSSEIGTAYLVRTSVSVTNLASITSAADASWNSVSISTANSATTMSTSGLSDGTYKVYAIDVAGNLSNASVGTLTLDSVAPSVSLGAVTIPNTSSVTVQSNEVGTAYLVNTTVSVTNLASITGSDGKNWNSVTISQATTDTSLAATGLVEGTYRAYAVDAAGNLSSASSNSANITLTSQVGFSLTNVPLTLAYNGTVTVGTSGGNGTGAVAFATTSPSVCSVNASSGLVTMLAATGTCSIAATKAADDVYYAASINANIDAIKATQAALSISGATSGAYSDTVQLSTTGGSTAGNVTWSHGSSTACSVNSSGLVTVSAGSGTCSVTASMAGNANYESVSASAHSITVSKATQASLTVTTTEATYGQTLVLAVSGGSGSGVLTWAKVSGTCSVSNGEVTPVNVGDSCVVKVTKAADGNYLERSSANTNISTVRAPQTGFTITSASSFVTGTPLTLTASGGQTNGVITWSVTSGICSITSGKLNATRGGITCVVSASRAGDSNYLTVTDSQTVSVDKIAQVLTITSTPPSPALVGSTYTVVVTSDAFLAPVIAVAQQSQSVCSVQADVVTFKTTGVCLVSVSQSGNDTYSSAAISQSITVTASAPTPVTGGSDAGSGEAPSTTAPRSLTTTTLARQAGSTTSTTSTTTTTTTTTTLAPDPSRPQVGADGSRPELKAGETMAMVRGEMVTAQVTFENGVAIISLPNKVQLRIGSSQAGESAQVSSDGVLRVSRREEVQVELSGLVPGTTYTVFMFSDPVELGRGVATAQGGVSGLFQTPDDAEYGDHTLQVNGVGPGGEIVSLSLGIEVLERQSNVLAVVLALGSAILLALLGGKPIFTRRRKRA